MARFGRWMPRLRRTANRVLASDPGLKRLRDASRAVLTVAVSAAVSYLLIAVVAGGFALSPLFGGVVALMTTMAVRDSGLTERKITTLLLFLPATLSVSIARILSSMLWAQWLALAAIVFSAFYLRRFGPRYAAVGLLGTIPFFVSSIVSSLLGFGAGQLPWIAAAIAIGVLCAYLIRFYLLPDNPRNALRRSLSAFDIQLGLTLEAITGTLADRRSDEDRDRRLRREADRLHERASAAEGQLLAEETDISRERSDRLRLHLFDSEMSANTLWEIIWRDATSGCVFPAEVREPLLRALGELCATLHRGGSTPGEASRALQDLEHARAEAAMGESDAGWSFQVRRADAAIRQLSEGAGEEEERGPAIAEQEEDEGEKQDDEGNERAEERSSPRERGIAGRLRPTTVQGIQAALAVSLALAAGQVFSSSRPYWVVIIAFVVFIGSGTLNDTLTRAFQRTVGTLAGAVVGFFLATLVSGDLYLEVPLVVACVFLAFYMFSISQTLLMFWITIVLALAFDIVGFLGGGGILVLRFFDTLLGSAIGFVVAALVFPTRPSEELRQLTADFLDSLEGYVRNRVQWLAGGEASRHPVEQARDVGDKLQALIQNATTARRQWMVIGRSRTDLNRWMTGLLALDYYARHLAGPVGRRQCLEKGTQQSEMLREIGDRIASNISSLRQEVSDRKQPEIRDMEDLMQQLENDLAESAEQRERETAGNDPGVSTSLTLSPPPGQAGPANALHYLRRINRTLGELAAEPEPGKRKSSRGDS